MSPADKIDPLIDELELALQRLGDTDENRRKVKMIENCLMDIRRWLTAHQAGICAPHQTYSQKIIYLQEQAERLLRCAEEGAFSEDNNGSSR